MQLEGFASRDDPAANMRSTADLEGLDDLLLVGLRLKRLHMDETLCARPSACSYFPL
jgi:hypothetical protein